MKFKFPFQNVLSYRKTMENLAQKDFQEVSAELARLNLQLIQMQEEVIQARENRFKKQVEGGKSAPALSQVEDYIKGQDIRMAQQRAKIQECEKRVEELREILRQKAIDYKIIEGLKDRKREEFQLEQRKLDQKQTDEMNTMRFRPEGKK